MYRITSVLAIVAILFAGMLTPSSADAQGKAKKQVAACCQVKPAQKGVKTAKAAKSVKTVRTAKASASCCTGGQCCSECPDCCKNNTCNTGKCPKGCCDTSKCLPGAACCK